MKRNTVIAAVVAFGMGGFVGAFAPNQPVWSEVQWPFPMDEWGIRCKAADCGAEVNVYIRAKIGFCNCTTGVSDDDELARLSDFNLMGDKPVVLAPGHPIAVAWMKGRSRSYAIAHPFQSGRSALSVAFNDHCDAVVATVVVTNDQPATIEPGVIEFLNSKTILSWAEVTLGL